MYGSLGKYGDFGAAANPALDSWWDSVGGGGSEAITFHDDDESSQGGRSQLVTSYLFYGVLGAAVIGGVVLVASALGGK